MNSGLFAFFAASKAGASAGCQSTNGGAAGGPSAASEVVPAARSATAASRRTTGISRRMRSVSVRATPAYSPARVGAAQGCGRWPAPAGSLDREGRAAGGRRGRSCSALARSREGTASDRARRPSHEPQDGRPRRDPDRLAVQRPVGVDDGRRSEALLRAVPPARLRLLADDAEGGRGAAYAHARGHLQAHLASARRARPHEGLRARRRGPARRATTGARRGGGRRRAPRRARARRLRRDARPRERHGRDPSALEPAPAVRRRGDRGARRPRCRQGRGREAAPWRRDGDRGKIARAVTRRPRWIALASALAALAGSASVRAQDAAVTWAAARARIEPSVVTVEVLDA